MAGVMFQCKCRDLFIELTAHALVAAKDNYSVVRTVLTETRFPVFTTPFIGGQLAEFLLTQNHLKSQFNGPVVIHQSVGGALVLMDANGSQRLHGGHDRL
ncbi:hypothetical protein RE6C_00953 [Rhodopirellula europaea 6C]|uniref:Uncharacterized protein n=1 Tax=Rhodopirellula europaea 6C TaxID=1263867 RepID=M2A8M1_9BACT|nr:hypothetical protein RE6C_00953 [Rhodopirellula europaea 6C]